MNVFKKYSIKHIFFGAFSFFLIVVLIVITLVSYHFSANELIKTTTEYQKSNLRLLSTDMDNRMKYIQDISIVLSRQQNLRNVARGNVFYTQQLSLTNELSNLVYSIPALHSVEVYMKNPPVDSFQYPVRYENLSTGMEEEWFLDLNSVLYDWIGKREVDTISGEQSVISYARLMNTSRGNLQAILLLNLDPIILQGWLRQYSDSTNLVILDTDGTILATTGSREIGDDYYVDRLPSSIENTPYTFMEDDGDLIVAATIPANNWIIMETTPYEEIIEGSRLMAGSLVVIGVISIVFALFVTFFLTKRFTDPILHLVRTMKNYRLNESSDALPTGYKNEFGQLFQGYKELISRSETLHNSLIEQNKRQREAEIKALQANINPHFLYNTLDQLNWSAIEHGYEDMSHMLELLGKMLRIGLSKGESIISLDDEMKYLHYYLQIQKIQKGELLDYEIDIPKELLHYYIPKLTFQPFVENSIIHGFQGRRQGKVELKVREQEEHIIITIDDNGIGFKTIEKNGPNKETGGYGINNVVERLDVYFGKQATINVKNRIEGGTSVTIRIPKVRDRNNIENIKFNNRERLE
ncbi:sensor histidine kinase [Evansella sp. AB-rgal1]|uniref:sensor histidine kinase n=1 Tax=Evansella sp. AB-rgal1 TaxID=3242696 RepID=UPI00359DECF8